MNSLLQSFKTAVYINKMERFSLLKVGVAYVVVAYVGVCISRCFIEELAWATDKCLEVISNLKQLYHEEIKE